MTIVTLSDVIKQVESGGNLFAMRFENALYFQIEMVADLPTGDPAKDRFGDAMRPILDRIQGIHECSRQTAGMIVATSWGEYQILGENLYSRCGVLMPVLSFVYSIRAQAAAFYQFLKHTPNTRLIPGADYSLLTASDKQEFATFYNGPGNVVEYVKTMDLAETLLQRGQP